MDGRSIRAFPAAAALLLGLFVLIGGEALAANDRDAPVWFLKVQNAPGEIKSRKSGGMRLGCGCNGYSGNSSGGSYTKTVTSTLRWTAEVRLRGKAQPKSVEVRAFYIGKSGTSGTPQIFKSETVPVKLDERGKGVVSLTAPTVTQTKTRQQVSNGSRCGNGGFVRSSTSVQGQKMDGCVVQLVVDGKVAKVWSSVSAWSKIAWDDPFTQESLVRRPKNALR